MKNNRHNCKLILEHDPLLKDVFRHNILTEQTDIVKPVWWERISPAFTDMDLNYIMLYLEETYGLTMDKIVQKSIVHQADRNKYHPVRDYLNSLQWDGQERIRYVLHHFLGAPSAPELSLNICSVWSGVRAWENLHFFVSWQ